MQPFATRENHDHNLHVSAAFCHDSAQQKTPASSDEAGVKLDFFAVTTG